MSNDSDSQLIGKGAIALALIGFAVPSAVFGLIVSSIQGVLPEKGDKPAATAIFDMSAAIEAEKEASPDKANLPLEEFDAITSLPENWEEGLYKKYEIRKYYISEDSTPDNYCLMVEQSYGEEAPKGIVYSSENDYLDARERSDCGDKNFVQVAGPDDEIEINDYSAAEVILPYVSLPTAVALFFGGYNANVRRKMWIKRRNQMWDALPAKKSYPPEFRSKLQKRVDDVIRRWADFETDPVKVLDYPMVTNMGFAPTSEFHLALLHAKSAVSDDDHDLGQAQDKVVDLEHAYKVMISEAQRMKWSSFSVEEQKHLSKAQAFLQMALNSSSSSHERNVAYKRLLKEVEGILSLSSVTRLAIEGGATLHISGQSS